MITWPTFFPNPSAQYSVDIEPVLSRNANNIRPSQRARMARNARLKVKCVFDISFTDFKLFTSIHRHLLNNGNDWFLLPLLFETGIEEKTARFINGRFDAKYRLDGRFNVSCEMELK